MSEEFDPFAEPTEEEKAAQAELEAKKAEAKAKKAEKVGKSTVVFAIYPCSDDADLKQIEDAVREIKMASFGLLLNQSTNHLPMVLSRPRWELLLQMTLIWKILKTKSTKLIMSAVLKSKPSKRFK